MKGVVIVQQKQRGRRHGLRMAAGVLAAAILWGVGGSAMAAASVRTVIPVGRAVGIKLFSDGVLVVGLSAIPTQAGSAAPAKECGLREGDIITHINSEEVDTIAGYILVKLGNFPVEGQELETDGLRIVVEEMDKRRIEKVHIFKIEETENTEVPEKTEE